MSCVITVTIIVCTRNRCSSLKSALASLALLNTEGLFAYDIIVVNNGSEDDTSQVVLDAAKTSVVTVTEYIEDRPGIVYARNRGVCEAKGDWIAFFDDDQIADPNWLLRLIDCAQQMNCFCVGGAVRLNLPESFNQPVTPFCRMLLGETNGATDIQAYTAQNTPGAGNMLIHRSVFANVGVFREEYNGRGEDTDLFLRMDSAGITGWYTPNAVVHHVIPIERLSLPYLLRVACVMGEGMAVFERNRVGTRTFLLLASLRICHSLFILLPQLTWARIMGDVPRYQGFRCRVQLIQSYLCRGVRLVSRSSH